MITLFLRPVAQVVDSLCDVSEIERFLLVLVLIDGLSLSVSTRRVAKYFLELVKNLFVLNRPTIVRFGSHQFFFGHFYRFNIFHWVNVYARLRKRLV